MKTLSYTILFAVLCSNFSFVFSQEPRYLVTRFNFKLLNWQKIDDPSLKKSTVNDFLTSEGRDYLKELVNKGQLNIANLEAEKIFPHHRTSDSLSMSRQGQIVPVPPFWATFRLEVPEGMKWDEFYTRLSNMYPVIIYVDPPLELMYLDVPNDSLFYEQESLRDTLSIDLDIAVDSAWNIETGKQFIKVGIFDSGIDSLHPDLNVLGGYSYYDDFVVSDSSVVHSWGRDETGHGTRIGGIIGAKRNNGIGVAGIAGGDGSSDTSGVSLLDFKLTSSTVTGDWASMAVIDAARAPLNYYNWTQAPSVYGPPTNEFYWQSAPGFGIHIGNHSYALKVLQNVFQFEDVPGDSLPPPPPAEIQECHLCRESFLFSLRNGVTSFTARGNNFDPLNLIDPTGTIPQSYHDSWLTVVGASGTDGEHLYFFNDNVGGGTWNSPIKNLDILAPGASANIATTSSSNIPGFSTLGWYSSFNGTSASSPHAAGVAALLLSRYNKPCYSNQNLDPADIEYILEQSATDLNISGPDDSTGYGRLNAWKAMQMIDFPYYQIIHPQDNPLDINILSLDTVHFYLDKPLQPDAIGPLSSSFPFQINWSYQAERYEVELTYDFSQYIGPTTQLLDTWVRHSQSNSLDLIADTITNYVGTPIPQPVFSVDTFSIEPMAYITDVINDSLITIKGYYYHFIGQSNVSDNFNFGFDPIDQWYPNNINTTTPRMAYSIYIYDEHPTAYDFPCDSANILLDPGVGLNEIDVDRLRLFPNPGSYELHLLLPAHCSNGKIELRNMNGGVIFTDNYTNSTKHTLRLDNLSSGLYLVHVLDESGVQFTQKWIKQ